VKFKLDENLPVSAAAVLAEVGHDVDTVSAEGLTGATDPDVTKTIGDLANLAELASLTGSVAILQRGLLRIRHP